MVKKGQIWKFSYGINPFKEKIEYEYEVLDVKKGFVQYKDIKTGKVASDRMSTFIFGSVCIKR